MGRGFFPSFCRNVDTMKLKLDISTRNESSEEKVTINKIAGDCFVQGNSPRLIILGAHHLSAFHYNANANEKRPHSACSLLFIFSAIIPENWRFVKKQAAYIGLGKGRSRLAIEQ
jgi:hypothetical protein